MIVDNLENASRYYCLHPLFSQAFDFIKQTNLQSAETGKVEVSEGLKAIFSNAPGKTKENSLAKFECHNGNIDIQLCISGKETIGWKPRGSCETENGNYNQEKDVQYYLDEPDMYFQLTDGQFAIFFPDDVHAPMIGDGDIKKLVMKVKI
ncbi:YhcH/YjgK/YiaL family protein [soil metagenome]